MWYPDDGAFVGSRSAIAHLLDVLLSRGPSFRQRVNLFGSLMVSISLALDVILQSRYLDRTKSAYASSGVFVVPLLRVYVDVCIFMYVWMDG